LHLPGIVLKQTQQLTLLLRFGFQIGDTQPQLVGALLRIGRVVVRILKKCPISRRRKLKLKRGDLLLRSGSVHPCSVRRVIGRFYRRLDGPSDGIEFLLALQNRIGGRLFGACSFDIGACLRHFTAEFIDPGRTVLFGPFLQLANLTLQRCDFRVDCVDASLGLHQRHGLVLACRT
jgi:hypothetical protein